MKVKSAIFASVFACAMLGVSAAQAVVFTGTNPPAFSYTVPPGDGPNGTFTPTITPSNYGDWVYSSDSNIDVGAQNPTGAVETFIEAQLGVPVTFVGGGACGTAGIVCSGGSGSYTGTAANIFGVHFDNKFLVLEYASLINFFSIAGLGQGVSNIYAYMSAVPLPGALILFGTALAGLGILGRRRRSPSPSAV
jgi:hypothetical protein